MNNKPEMIIKPNPNQSTFEAISEAVKENGNYCCCAITKEPDTMCLCKKFREQQDAGFCHCGRFYKVNDYPTIIIIHTPEDEEHAIDLASSLTTEGFIVILPLYHDTLNYMLKEAIYRELQMTKIHKADLVFVVNSNEEAMEFLEEQILWAEDLQKKIIFEYNEEVKDED